jgi:hypothetical protein
VRKRGERERERERERENLLLHSVAYVTAEPCLTSATSLTGPSPLVVCVALSCHSLHVDLVLPELLLGSPTHSLTHTHTHTHTRTHTHTHTHTHTSIPYICLQYTLTRLHRVTNFFVDDTPRATLVPFNGSSVVTYVPGSQTLSVWNFDTAKRTRIALPLSADQVSRQRYERCWFAAL